MTLPLITWTCVLGVHRRCHPRGVCTDPASASSDPGSDLRRYEKEGLVVMQGRSVFFGVRTVCKMPVCLSTEMSYR